MIQVSRLFSLTTSGVDHQLRMFMNQLTIQRSFKLVIYTGILGNTTAEVI